MAGYQMKCVRENYHFKNWSRTFECHPDFFYEPQTLDEIKQVMRLANVGHRNMRVIGNGNSPSDICVTSDIMLSLRHYNKILEVDTEACVVRAQGGILLSTLNHSLHEHGLALSVLGSISDISLAGAMSTGTHGSGAKYGILASYALEIELMYPSGEIALLSRENDEEMFLAACVSLGSLGIILSVTLQCEPAFKLEHSQFATTLTNALDMLDVHRRASDHFRFVWFPHTENVTMWHTNRTTKPFYKKSSYFWDTVIGYHVLELLYCLSTFCPWLVRLINWMYFSLLYIHPKRLVDESHYVFKFDCKFHQYVTEWAIPVKHTESALKELKQWITRSKFPAHFPVEVRFVKADDIYLSPAYGRDSTYINIVMYRPYNIVIPHDKYFTAFESIMRRHEGRPHWAKEYEFSQEEFRQTYEKWDKFCEIRSEVDPKGLFLNEYTKRLFVPNYVKSPNDPQKPQ